MPGRVFVHRRGCSSPRSISPSPNCKRSISSRSSSLHSRAAARSAAALNSPPSPSAFMAFQSPWRVCNSAKRTTRVPPGALGSPHTRSRSNARADVPRASRRRCSSSLPFRPCSPDRAISNRFGTRRGAFGFASPTHRDRVANKIGVPYLSRRLDAPWPKRRASRNSRAPAGFAVRGVQ